MNISRIQDSWCVSCQHSIKLNKSLCISMSISMIHANTLWDASSATKLWSGKHSSDHCGCIKYNRYFFGGLTLGSNSYHFKVRPKVILNSTCCKDTWNNEGCIYCYEKIAARENEQVDGWSDLNHHGKGLLISLNMIPTWKTKRTNTKEYGYRIRFDRRKEVIIVQDNYRNNGRKSIQRK